MILIWQRPHHSRPGKLVGYVLRVLWKPLKDLSRSWGQVVQFMFLKEHFGCSVENRLEGSKNGSGMTSATAMAQDREDDDLARVVTEMTKVD